MPAAPIAASVAVTAIVSCWRRFRSIEALRAGNLDGLVMDEFEAVELARADAAFDVLPDPAALEHYGLVLRLEDAELRDALNEALRDLEDAGTLRDLRRRYGLDRPADWPVEIPGE